LTELERALLLPIELPYPLPSLLKDVIRGVFLRGRMQADTGGLLQVVAQGCEQWNQNTAGLELAQAPLTHAYVRAIAIAIPELFVAAVDGRSFGGYPLDESERRVADDARKDFDAKVSLALMVGGSSGAAREQVVFNLLRQSVVNGLGRDEGR
jgi:hypothetical protein